MSSAPAQKDNRWQLPSKYEIRQVIGTGSYGSVWEAQDLEQNRLVAVKRIKHLFDDLVDCKRILREVAILSRLKHESIVRLHDIIAPGSPNTFGELYIIMEICDSDLKKLCRTDVTLTALHINTLLYNLLVGVKYLHSAGIYHRDLKPANCLVNQDCSVKICDFGLSRAIGGECLGGDDALMTGAALSAPAEASKPAPSRRHLTGHVVTRWYRAPELILLQESYTTAIDMWSVGCIYAELLGMLDGTHVMDRGPLFPGSSCFPLSPDHKHKSDYKYHTQGKHDMLNKIFSIIGMATDDEIEELDRDDAKKYIKCFAKRDGDGLKAKFPNVEPDAVDILTQMLKFSPKTRVTVSAALEHPLCKDIRDPAKETTAPGMVVLDFEKQKELGERDLRINFCREVRKYHPEVPEML